jgi:Flp pilus assembly protein TadG
MPKTGMPKTGRISVCRKVTMHASRWLAQFARAEEGATAMIFGLACIMILLAGGVGLDMARAMVLKARMAEALDAAGLAVGATTGLTTAQMTTLAQQYFDANYPSTAMGTHGNVSVTVGGTNGSTISLSVTGTVPTTLMQLANINTLDVTVSNQISKSLTKLWVALALDNTGSMCEPDSQPCTNNTNPNIKINALKTATHQLLTTLQNAATNPGDVKVALIPFSKDVNVGMANETASWIDWTVWEAPPANGTPSGNIGPGSSCPYSTSDEGYRCQSTPTNGSSSVSNIPSSGAYAGYICPGRDNGSANSGFKYRYYNGCYNSVPTWTCTGSTCSCTGHSNCTCSGSGSSKVCIETPYLHTWVVNGHDTWSGCVMDRDQDNDTLNTVPTGSSEPAKQFPAENNLSCVPSEMYGSMSYDWSALNAAVDAMDAGGATNQTIGLVWGWQAFAQGPPLQAPALPQDTTQVIILLSDGLNTQNRWSGSGSSQSSAVDNRMALACQNAKTDGGVVIYTVYVDLNNGPDSQVLQNCATDLNHYFHLNSSGAIVTTFNQIGQTLANLHVAQ